ncbi:MAG: hypothetical protein AB1755_05260 [Candidatus Omnitrophota bacterium]
MFKKIVFISLMVSLLVFNIYAQAQDLNNEDKPKDAYMMEDIKQYLTSEENNYFMLAQIKMEEFMVNNKDLENYLDSVVQDAANGNKSKINVDAMFAKLKMDIQGLISNLNTLNPPDSLKKYHQLNIEALELLIKKLDPSTLTNEAVQKRLDAEGDKIVQETNQEIDNLVKMRQSQS